MIIDFCDIPEIAFNASHDPMVNLLPATFHATERFPLLRLFPEIHAALNEEQRERAEALLARTLTLAATWTDADGDARIGKREIIRAFGLMGHRYIHDHAVILTDY